MQIPRRRISLEPVFGDIPQVTFIDETVNVDVFVPDTHEVHQALAVNDVCVCMPVRIEVTMENREGDFGVGGIVFGWQSRPKRTTVTIQEGFKNSIYVASYFGNPAQEVIYDCSHRSEGHYWGGRYIPECEYISVKDRKGPWRLAVEISGKVFRVFVDGRLLQTYTRDEDIVGNFYLTVGGAGCSDCESEWLFKDLRITELPSE